MTFGSWLLFCLPFCVTLCLSVWVLLRWRYPPQLRAIRLDLGRDQVRARARGPRLNRVGPGRGGALDPGPRARLWGCTEPRP